MLRVQPDPASIRLRHFRALLPQHSCRCPANMSTSAAAAAAAAVMQVCAMRMPVDLLLQWMPQIMEGMLIWSDDSKNKFRLKVGVWSAQFQLPKGHVDAAAHVLYLQRYARVHSSGLHKSCSTKRSASHLCKHPIPN